MTTKRAASEPLLTQSEVAEYLRVPKRTLEDWRYRWKVRQMGPVWTKAGRGVRYRQSDVDAWLKSQTVAA